MASALTLQTTFKLNSGYEMPRLGLGVYQMRECAAPCKAAFEAGYRHVDSAQMYRNEEQVGEAVNESGIPREDLFITTKCASRSHGYESTKKGVDESLKRFGFNYIDLFLIHDPLSGSKKRLETYKALVEAKEAGKLRSVGVSNYNVHHLEEIKKAGLPTPSVNQVELHPWCQQRPIADYCQKNGIIVEAYSPLTRGHHFNDPVLQKISKAHNKEPAQVLIRWSLQKGFSPLPKSATPSRVKSNAEVYDFELSTEEMAALDGLDKGDGGAITWNPVNAA